ncbi:MAG: ABC transporter permease subunit [Acidobacteriota bacterium]
MAVYERVYQRYTGLTTPSWARILVLPRYALRDVFRSRLLVFFFALCFVVPLMAAAVIYARHNLPLLDTFQLSVDDLIAVDARAYYYFLDAQFGLGFFLTLFVGTGLVSRDLAHNALPLYLARPISRAEYVTGKLLTLGLLLSAVTWIPGVLLFLFNGAFEGPGWMVENARLMIGTVIGSTLWLAVLSMLTLALSAWVKWRPVAAFALFMLYVMGSFFAFVTNQLFRTDWGHLVNLDQLVQIVTAALLGAEVPDGPPVAVAGLALLVFSAFGLLLLHLKIRAYEVVS